MKASFFKKILLCIMLSTAFILVGCGKQNALYNGVIDTNVNMTPRLIVSNNQSTELLVEDVRSAVVGISSRSNNAYSVGSGVAVADGGYILTNHHVIAGASEVVVYFANNTADYADIIWSDSALDLAIIKSHTNIPYLELGSLTNVKTGEDVIAIGTPLTLQFTHTVTKGIVSAMNRTLEVENENGISYLQNLIQHDASINPGNSGGPLISLEGKVIGINTLKATEAEGIGFAIPIDIGKAIVNKIVANNNYEQPYIGIFGFDAIIAQYYGETLNQNGVYVVNIDENSSAYLNGLKKGDVIVEIGNQQVNTMLDLRIGLYNYDIGDKITLKYVRDGKIHIITFDGEKRP